MAIKDQLERAVANVLTERFEISERSTVPDPSNVAFRNGAVRLAAATVLYADLADSTTLAAKFSASVAARVGKAFLAMCSTIIRAYGGELRSFDGDRVMAVFLDESAEAAAVRSAFTISSCFKDVLKPRLEKAFPDLSKDFQLGYACGIDRSEILVVAAGVRNDHDLIWIGRAPNVAAKLSSRREPPLTTWITTDVLNRLPDHYKQNANVDQVWEEHRWENGPVKVIHGSSCFFETY